MPDAYLLLLTGSYPIRLSNRTSYFLEPEYRPYELRWSQGLCNLFSEKCHHTLFTCIMTFRIACTLQTIFRLCVSKNDLAKPHF
jgi:hypothetical protein